MSRRHEVCSTVIIPDYQSMSFEVDLEYASSGSADMDQNSIDCGNPTIHYDELSSTTPSRSPSVEYSSTDLSDPDESSSSHIIAASCNRCRSRSRQTYGNDTSMRDDNHKSGNAGAKVDESYRTCSTADMTDASLRNESMSSSSCSSPETPIASNVSWSHRGVTAMEHDDNSRRPNTHTSILNSTLGDEDDDSLEENDDDYQNLLFTRTEMLEMEDASFMGDDDDINSNNGNSGSSNELMFHLDDSATTLSSHPSRSSLACCYGTTTGSASSSSADMPEVSLLDQFMDQFMDTLCTSHQSSRCDRSRVCGSSDSSRRYNCLHSDLVTLLGSSGGDFGMVRQAQWKFSHLFHTNHTSSNHPHSDDSDTLRPRRVSPVQRKRRVRQLLEQRGCLHEDRPLTTVTSMQEPHCRRRDDSQRRRSRRPTIAAAGTTAAAAAAAMVVSDDDDDGYDSDPCVTPHHQPRSTPVSVVPSDWADNVLYTVQEALNRQWQLIWHQPSPSSHSKNDGSTIPIQVTAWIERGTLLGTGKTVEPKLMWKATRGTNNHTPTHTGGGGGTTATTPTPNALSSAKLLHICRIRPCVAEDRRHHSWLRASTGLVVRTVTTTPVQDGDTADTTVFEDHYFQAATAVERDAVVLFWKLTTARFAALAVLQDAEALLQEFFVRDSVQAHL